MLGSAQSPATGALPLVLPRLVVLLLLVSLTPPRTEPRTMNQVIGPRPAARYPQRTAHRPPPSPAIRRPSISHQTHLAPAIPSRKKLGSDPVVYRQWWAGSAAKRRRGCGRS